MGLGCMILAMILALWLAPEAGVDPFYNKNDLLLYHPKKKIQCRPLNYVDSYLLDKLDWIFL
jgi:hypothetical protein